VSPIRFALFPFDHFRPPIGSDCRHARDQARLWPVSWPFVQ
jgi:hypothetical protein